MGFKVKRFFHSDLIKTIPELFCNLCDDVMNESMIVTTCGHVFCKECIRGLIIEEVSVCPVDGQPFDFEDIKENKALNELLGTFLMRCDNYTFGCKETIKMKYLLNHSKECAFSPPKLLKCESIDQNDEKCSQNADFTVTDLEVKCELCQNTFSTHSHLMAHQPCYFTVRGIKGKQKVTFECDICSKQFPTLSLLRQHLAYHKDMNKFVCNHCGKGFCVIEHMQVHIQTHAGKIKRSRKKDAFAIEGAFERLLASKQKTTRVEDVIRQRLKEEAAKGLDQKSGFCGEKVASKMGKSLTLVKRKVSCCFSSCGKSVECKSHSTCSAERKSSLGVSSSELEDMSPARALYSCELCPKRFIHMNNLRNHLATHVEKDLFRCTVCGKTFCRQHQAEKHKKKAKNTKDRNIQPKSKDAK